MAEELSELVAQADSLGVALGPSQASCLLAYEDLLRTRGLALGLVSNADADRLRSRHLLDCLRAVSVVHAEDRSAYDLGSGGGLPGIVVGIARPRLLLTLVESRRNRAAFLELAVESLGLGNIRVRAGRIQESAEPVDLCFARALASIGRSWEFALPLLKPGGRLVYFAGERFEQSGMPSDTSRSEILHSPALASSGPLVIMSRP
jgi:16S rRNA (guanine527-N7)-methyltransferase